ncbi:MAG TPA: glycoside hydrolase family 99-like domain-containing protein [Pseudoxanthomonas sp.]|nr:glycoside hydrolase family 99-like domain-containing protein [Pseudoxanthomonas sp.]
MPLSTRDRLRQRFLDRYSSLVPPAPRGQLPTDGARARRPYVRSDERAIGYVPYSKGELPDPLPATLVAFYLPQFHTIPENDEWWGKGFTEWRNVTRALPQFEGHHQPRLPGDLGFYDLRNVEVMREQARLAKEYGISAFCFYFYWFGGKTLLEQPLRQWLSDPTLDLGFCLCWANENWSRRWDGRNHDIFVVQQHSAEDDLAFIAYIAPYLRDPRYLRIEGKPLLLVYRPDLLPDLQETAARWRRACRENGIGELHIAYVQGFERTDPNHIGFDAAVEFPPNLSNPQNLTTDQRLLNPEFEGEVLDWRELAADYSARGMPAYPLYPGVNVGWDNEPRRPAKSRVYAHASPRGYRDWLRNTIWNRLANRRPPERLVFINAWNEWAEGAVLEPDSALGHAWLNATREALIHPPNIITSTPRPCVVLHAWHLDILEEMIGAYNFNEKNWRLIVTTSPEKLSAVKGVLARLQVSAELHSYENRGRDILPFLYIAEQLLREDDQSLMLKLHTKRSPHISDGEQWRRDMQEALASRDQANRILQAFNNMPELGLVAPRGHLLWTADFLASNRENLHYLAARCGIPPYSATVGSAFAAGSMFWVRAVALRPLLDARISPREFESESGQTDGTLAHAVERICATVVTHANYRVLDSALTSSPSQLSSYGFARRAP